MYQKCPLGCAFYDQDECCIGCDLCLAETIEERIEAEKKLKDYLAMSPEEKGKFIQKGAYFEEE